MKIFLLGEKGSGRVKIALGCEPLDSDSPQLRIFSHPKIREFIRIGFVRYGFMTHVLCVILMKKAYCKVTLKLSDFEPFKVTEKNDFII